MRTQLILSACLLAVYSLIPPLAIAQGQPLRVFILAGQSNMQGHARLSSLPHMAQDPKTLPLYEKMVDEHGNPRAVDDVWISYFGPPDEEVFGQLTAGYGARRNIHDDDGKIGPEWTFGITMRELVGDGPILIIKTAWGGKSLHTDFRPPSAEPYTFSESQLERMQQQGRDHSQARREKDEASGKYYQLMMAHVRDALTKLDRIPTYDKALGYELAGFVWFQGWNDMVDRGTYPNRDKEGGYDQYSQLMSTFIRDVRRDLATPELPFVIGVMGVGGPTDLYEGPALRNKAVHDNFRKAMAAPANQSEFAGNVAAVYTEEFWDQELDAASKKLDLIAQKERQLRNQNKDEGADGYLDRQQQQAVIEAYRRELLTPQDEEVLVGKTNAAYHYLGSAKILGRIGQAFAQSAFELLSDDPAVR